jgi:hypothetical protein
VFDRRPFDEHPETPKQLNKENRMVILPFSPTACAVVTTMMLALTFYAGRWCGIKWCADELMKMMKEIEKND